MEEKLAKAVRIARGHYHPSGTNRGIWSRIPAAERCPVCEGSGTLEGRTSTESSSHGLTEYVSCSVCNGSGKTDPSALRRFDETGVLMTDRTYNFLHPDYL